jgi:hypothetical protein
VLGRHAPDKPPPETLDSPRSAAAYFEGTNQDAGGVVWRPRPQRPARLIETGAQHFAPWSLDALMAVPQSNNDSLSCLERETGKDCFLASWNVARWC